MKRIPLTQGKFALVDDEDFERVMQFKWQFHKQEKGKPGFEATRGDYSGPRQKMIRMHRFILGNRSPHTDHKNGNGLDNRKCNLRPCLAIQNARNRRMSRNNTSGFKGVSFARDVKKWKAYFYLKQRQIYLGLFSSAKDAARAYDKNVKRVFGKFARTNQQMGLL